MIKLDVKIQHRAGSAHESMQKQKSFHELNLSSSSSFSTLYFHRSVSLNVICRRLHMNVPKRKVTIHASEFIYANIHCTIHCV